MIYWLWLNSILGIGPCVQKELLQVFVTPENIYNASYSDLIACKGIGDGKARAIVSNKSLELAERIALSCERLSISIANIDGKDYLRRFLSIKDSPTVLFYKGKFFEPDKTVGIVGPRMCTQETKLKTIDIATKCICDDKVIVSGLAKGVDAYAHTTAVKNKVKTIAVVGCGLDICYPKSHLSLFEKIEKNGLIISEYPPGTPPISYNFPKRNRLIAALSDELYVIDPGRGSGSLITAKYFEQKHDGGDYKYGKNHML